ncbi:hypothetical protein DTA01_03385 [Escherichia coli]|nr:hypothetical protein DTA01_03385 [Escherichia coli]
MISSQPKSKEHLMIRYICKLVLLTSKIFSFLHPYFATHKKQIKSIIYAEKVILRKNNIK